MKRVLTPIAVVLTAALLSLWIAGPDGAASAQPITGGNPPGISRVHHGSALYGLGTTGTPLDLRHDCGDGSGMTWSAAGSAWVCAALGAGFTTAGSGLASSGSTVSLNATGCSTNYVLAYNGTGWTCQAQSGGGGSAAYVSITQAVTSGTPNLTTLGTVDWLVNQSYTPISGLPLQYWRKLSGARQIEYPEWSGSFSNIANQNRTQTVTWTATDNLSQGSAGAGFNTVLIGYNASSTGWGFTTSAPSTITGHTFTIYVANYNETDGVQCTAVLADGEYSAQSVSFTMTGTDNRTVTVAYNSLQATRINVTCLLTSNPAGANLGWLALWLA